MNFQGIWANIFHIYQPPHWPKRIIDKVTRESYRPFAKFLLEHPSVHITLNITGSLTEQLLRHGHKGVIASFEKLAQRGQVELISTGAHHPILPLVTKPIASASIAENMRINRRLFSDGMPSGIWLPELSYAPSLDTVLKKHRIEWLILDEIATATPRASYAPHSWKTKSGLSVIFRHPEASAFFFQPLKKHTADPIRNHLKKKRTSFPLITATDGENLGHHNPGMLAQWSNIVTMQSVHTVTISELLHLYEQQRTITLRDASWADSKKSIRGHNPYILWKNKRNAIHQAQWKLSRQAMRIAKRRGASAILSLEKVLYSDQYWWASDMPWWDPKVVLKGAQLQERFITRYGSKKEADTAGRLLEHISIKLKEHSRHRESTTSNIMFGGKIV